MEEVLVCGYVSSGHIGSLKSSYRGVSFHNSTQQWRVRLKVQNKSKHLGYFTSNIDAAIAYNEAARKYHGRSASIIKNVELVTVAKNVVKTRVLGYRIGSQFAEKEPLPMLLKNKRKSEDIVGEFSFKREPLSEDDIDLRLLFDFDSLQLNGVEPSACEPSQAWEELFLEMWFSDSVEELKPSQPPRHKRQKSI